MSDQSQISRHRLTSDQHIKRADRLAGRCQDGTYFVSGMGILPPELQHLELQGVHTRQVLFPSLAPSAGR